MPEKNSKEPDDTVFRVFGLKTVEGKVPDYTADMLEVYRNIGVLSKRLEAAEQKLREILMEG